MLEQSLIKFDDLFILWSFPLGKHKLVVVLEEVTFKTTQFDLKKSFKSNLIPYESHDIKLLLKPRVTAYDSLLARIVSPHAAADDII